MLWEDGAISVSDAQHSCGYVTSFGGDTEVLLGCKFLDAVGAARRERVGFPKGNAVCFRTVYGATGAEVNDVRTRAQALYGPQKCQKRDKIDQGVPGLVEVRIDRGITMREVIDYIEPGGETLAITR